MLPRLISNLRLEQILKKVLGEIDKEHTILTGSIIGSYHLHLDEPNYVLNEVDVYLVFDVDKLTESIYNHTKNRFLSQCEKLADLDREGFNYLLETRFGPFEPTEEKEFQFHLLIDDREECEKILNTIKWMWRSKRIDLFGMPIEELGIFKPRRIRRREVLTCYGGIKPYIRDIKDKVIPYAEWVFKDGRFIKERKLKKDNSDLEQLDFMEHVCIVSLKNVLRYREQDQREFYQSRNNSVSLSQKYFPDNLDFIQKLDQREIFVPGESVNSKAEKAIAFLEYLISKVP